MEEEELVEDEGVLDDMEVEDLDGAWEKVREVHAVASTSDLFTMTYDLPSSTFDLRPILRA